MINEFKFRDYLNNERIAICASVIFECYLFVLLLIVRASMAISLFILAGLGLLLLILLFTRYFHYKKRIEKIRYMMDSIEDKYLCGELMKKPTNYIEEVYFEIMKEISRSAITEIEGHRKKEIEYREYIEGFVHEVKTPLMAAGLIAKNENASARIRNELKKADNQVESVLYFAKLDSLDKDIVIKETDLEELVSNALAEEMDLLISSNISVEVDAQGLVLTDPVMFRMVLRQLLVNASKYCTGCKIKIYCQDNKLIVEDNGPGIVPKEIDRVCKKGFVGSEGRKNPSSTGMGLYIASSICEKLNVDMEIESEIGQYTKFLFTLQKCKVNEN